MSIHQIPIPTPFYVGPVNVYLLEGDPLTLVDCGPRTAEAEAALVSGLAGLGYQLSDIEQLIITHHHTDHIGLTKCVIEESGAVLLAHEYTLRFLYTPDEARIHDLAFFHQVCVEGGVPADVIRIVDKVSHWVDQFGNLPLTHAQALKEGDTVVAGGTTWQVYHTPGHAGDLICLYDPQSETLLASDHLILKISSNPLIEPAPQPDAPRPRRLVEYIEHLQRIAALPIQIAYSGHGEPVTAIAELVAKRIGFHHQRADKILGYFEDGPANLWELTEKLFAHVRPEEKFLAISEVLGHVDLLEQEQRLQRQCLDGIVYWTK